MRGFWGSLGVASCAAWLVTTVARAQTGPVEASSGRSSSAGHFEVALHARSTRAAAHVAQAAWLTVTLPLDKVAAPGVPAPPVLPAPAAEGWPPPVVTGPSGLPAAPHFTFQQLHALSEFSLRAVGIALGVAGAAAGRRRFDSLTSRARSSALLPEVRLRAVRDTDQALRWAPTTDDPYRVTQADGAGTLLEVSATFRLDRLLFARDELTVEGLRLRAAEARLKLETRVRAALLGLIRARELGCAGEQDESSQAEQAVRALELFAELDVLTAGWFSDQAPGLGRAVWGFPEAVLGLCAAPEPASEQAGTNAVASLENSE